MQISSAIQTHRQQLDALATGCGLVRWDNPTLVQHTGGDALDLLHRLTTNDLLSVAAGKSRRTVLASDRGRVVDVFLVARLSDDELLLISDSEKPERSISAIDYYTIVEDARLTDISGSHTRISLVGPGAAAVVGSALGTAVERDVVVAVEFDGAPLTVVFDSSRGVGWIDVVFQHAAESPGCTNRLETAFENAGAVTVGRDSFELFRIDRQIPGADREWGEHANPIESGLLELVDFDKGCYVGQEVIARLDAYDRVKRNLKVLESDVPLAVGASLQYAVAAVAVAPNRSGVKPAGVVTSASPLATDSGRYLALGLVRKAFSEAGTVLDSTGKSVRVR